MKKILITFYNLYISCLLMNAQQPVKINNYELNVVLQDSIVAVSAVIRLSCMDKSKTKSEDIFLLFNSCAKIQEFYMNNQSINYFMRNDTIWFTKPVADTMLLNVHYTISCSMLYDTTTKDYSPHPQECSRAPFLYNHWQIMFERWHRWYPVLYDNFAQYHVRITTPLPLKAFAFVPADSIRQSGNLKIHYFTLFNEDFPVFVASTDVRPKETINENGVTFNFYYIPEHSRFIKWSEEKSDGPIFTNDPQQKDSLLRIISQRCIDAFFWYNDNLWKKDMKEINIIESAIFGVGFGLSNFIILDENTINVEFLYSCKVAHEIAHIWLGLHIKYESEGKYFLGESVNEYVNLLFYESWAGEKALEEAILNSKDFREFKNPPKFTVTFKEVLQSRKHSGEIELYAIYAKGPVFLHEFRKLIGKEKFLQIISDTYKEDNKLITMKDFENNIKKYNCWKAYRQLFKMRF